MISLNYNCTAHDTPSGKTNNTSKNLSTARTNIHCVAYCFGTSFVNSKQAFANRVKILEQKEL